MRRGARGAMLAAALVVVLALAAGCVAVPDSGVVRSGPTQAVLESEDPFFFSPPGPRPGDSPISVVAGFLEAMQAYPPTTAVARQFLTEAAREAWNPHTETLVYVSSSLAEPHRGTVTVDLSIVATLDEAGAWTGSMNRPRRVSERLTLEREAGEWRISEPPSGLVVPLTYFDSLFDDYSLYFFDATGKVLVPQPVHLPRSEQTATLLVEGLLRGPDTETLTTYFPEATSVDLSVPVSDSGLVEVPLSPEVLQLGSNDLRMLAAQLVWTLRQVPDVQRVRITVAGSHVPVPGLDGDPLSGAFGDVDPAAPWASSEVFGLRNGLLVAVEDRNEHPTTGPLGREDYGVSALAVDLPAEQVAAVTSRGRSLLLAPVEGDGGEEIAPVYSGTDLVGPAWDLHGSLWFADNRGSGARVLVDRSGSLREIEVAGVTGRRVKELSVSRDGSRFVAIVAGRRQDHLVTARVRRSPDGGVAGAGPATALPVGDDPPTELRDVAWTTPTSLAVLGGVAGLWAQVYFVSVDGSSRAGEVTTSPDSFAEHAVGLLAAPSAGTPLYVALDDGFLYELGPTGRWVSAGIEAGLHAATYVG